MTPLAWAIAGLLTLQTLILVWNIWYWGCRRFITSDPQVSLSVLIPALNERHTLPRLLAALSEQTCRPLEIIKPMPSNTAPSGSARRRSPRAGPARPGPATNWGSAGRATGCCSWTRTLCPIRASCATWAAS